MKDTMTFGEALEALKAGKKVARRGWNGKGMFLWLKPATVVKADWCHDPELKEIAEKEGGEIPELGTICMFTHDSTGRRAVLTGWLASQSDMLLDDWEVVGEEGAQDTPPPPDETNEPKENPAEDLGKAIGAFLTPLALLGAKPGDKMPEIHVNVWSFGSR